MRRYLQDGFQLAHTAEVRGDRLRIGVEIEHVAKAGQNIQFPPRRAGYDHVWQFEGNRDTATLIGIFLDAFNATNLAQAKESEKLFPGGRGGITGEFGQALQANAAGDWKSIRFLRRNRLCRRWRNVAQHRDQAFRVFAVKHAVGTVAEENS